MDGWIVGCDTRRCIHVGAVSAWLVLVVADACCLQQSFWLPKTASEPACACADGWIVGCDTQRSMLCSCLLPLTPVASACRELLRPSLGLTPSECRIALMSACGWQFVLQVLPGSLGAQKRSLIRFSVLERIVLARLIRFMSNVLFCEETLIIWGLIKAN